VLCLLATRRTRKYRVYSIGTFGLSQPRPRSQAPGRLLVTTFASSVHRINMILQLAQHNRVVSVVGRSMLNVIAHARNLGYIKCEDNAAAFACSPLPDEKVLILTTGSQGELMSAMTRISRVNIPISKFVLGIQWCWPIRSQATRLLW